MQNLDSGFIFSVLMLLGLAYIALIAIIAMFRTMLWFFSGIFQLLDEFMWFLYNPFRWSMRVGYEGRRYKFYRRIYVLLTFSLIAPAYKILIYFLTTPLRIITSLYFDVLMYLFVSTSDTIDELFKPQLGSMRFKKGFAYLWRWVLFFPYRLVWFIFKNIMAVIDSLCMLVVSIAWPTFTMFHGTSQEAVVDISREGRWYVGIGNFAGSGVYFGRSVKTAKLYAGTKAFTNKEGEILYPIIVARVTLTMLRNCTTLPDKTREKFGKMGSEGAQLAREVKFPFFATELWRTGNNWWEYCLLQGGKDGQYVNSWRIRPVGYVHVVEGGEYTGSLQRLWGGKSHYSLSFVNIAMTVVSAIIAFPLLFMYFEYQAAGGFMNLFPFVLGVLSGLF